MLDKNITLIQQNDYFVTELLINNQFVEINKSSDKAVRYTCICKKSEYM